MTARLPSWLPVGALLRRRPRPAPEPEWPLADPEECLIDGFTDSDRRGLAQLGDWLESAGGGTVAAGAGLADHLREQLPDVPACAASRVLLETLRHLQRLADEAGDDREAYQVVADAMRGAPLMLARIADLGAGLDEAETGAWLPWG